MVENRMFSIYARKAEHHFDGRMIAKRKWTACVNYRIANQFDATSRLKIFGSNGLPCEHFHVWASSLPFHGLCFQIMFGSSMHAKPYIAELLLRSAE